jgi:hypothetical protein
VQAVMPAVGEGSAALAGVPELADHVDRLLERGHGLARRQTAAAHRLDRLPEGARSEREVEPPAREQVEAGGRARDDSGRAQRHVEDVRGDADARGARGDERHERPRVEERGLVGVVLEGDEIQTGCLCHL